VLIGWFFSLAVVQIFFLAIASVCIAVFGMELLNLRRSGKKCLIGWRPLGGTGLTLATLWIAVAILSLVDFESNHRLFMSMTVYDHAPRTNWTESILRTGVPPVNPLYWFKQAAPMRYYYFWLVDCAAVAKVSHLSARIVMMASCVWAGFALAALIGLYLKHFLSVGARLRQQFLVAIFLLIVGGISICAQFWNMFYLHFPPPGDRWSLVRLVDWPSFFLFYPHHVASMVCCMFAFLLAWLAGKYESQSHAHAVSVVLIATALASAFGLSIYVAFAFFLVVVVWAIWQVGFERHYRPAMSLAAGGVGAIVLLLPYLWQLTHTTSKLGGGSVFAFTVRETIPPDGLLALSAFKDLSSLHPILARNLASLILLIPGYVIEMGYSLAVLLIYFIPRLRGHTPLTLPQRTMMVIAATTIPIMSLLRSGVLTVNDFGMHSALFMQFPMLLLASELLISWRFQRRKLTEPALYTGLPGHSPDWLRTLTILAIAVGVLTTTYKAITLRFFLPFYETKIIDDPDRQRHNLSHKAYISYIGYTQLNSVISQDAIVQFNLADPLPWPWWPSTDLFWINHQVAAISDQLWCGSELGGDPTGCPAMAAAIDAVYKGGTSQQASAVCRQYGIQYLVANIYDPAWQDRQSWVWTLSPVVSDPEFRALDCGH